MDRVTVLVPSSPTNSSPSSSDLDTESTGSFFPDRSTSLGTLMGVNFPADDVAVRTVTVPSLRRDPASAAAAAVSVKKRRRKTSWWRLCRDDLVGPTSLRDFLQVERRSVVGADMAAATEEEEEEQFFSEEHVAVGGGQLFKNGRVLPPPPAAEAARRRDRVPVLLAGICSGG